MVTTLRALVDLPDLEVRPEDLQFSMRRMPTRPDTGFLQLREIFHLEDQLAALDDGADHDHTL